MNDRLISDGFIKKVSSLTAGASKGELYYLLNHTIQQIYPEHDSQEELESHFESIFWILNNMKEDEKNAK